MTPKVALQPLSENDLPMLTVWLNEPHMTPFYMTNQIDGSEVRRKFLPRLSAGDPVRCLTASAEGEPFGYVQWYFNRSFPAYGAAALGFTDGISIDYFIGNPASLGKGLGAAMLRSFADHAYSLLPASDKIIYASHSNANVRAVACAKAAGFASLRSFTDKGVACTLFARRL